jgi:YggT family protein
VVYLAYNVLQLLKYLIIIRAIMSWFVSPTSRHPVVGFIYRVTDWIIKPVSSMLPRTGGIDLAPLAAFFIIVLFQQILLRLA